MGPSGDSYRRKGPLVSVLLPFHNAGVYLSDALGSILRQTYAPFEVLLINDGSTDDSLSIIEGFRDSRLSIVGDDQKRGLAFRLNQGISAANGKYIARMDADDICAERRLELQVARMESDGDLAVLGTAGAFIDSAGMVTGAPRESPLDDHQIKWRLLTSNCILHPSVMVRATVLNEHRYSTDYPVAQDFELWLRLAAADYRFANLPEVLMLVRRHNFAVSTVRRREQVEYAAKALVAYLTGRFGLPVSLNLAAALVEPPLLSEEKSLTGTSPFGVLGEAAARLLNPLGIGRAGRADRTLDYIDDDVLFYALRYLFRASKCRPAGTSLRDVVGFNDALRAILLRLPRAARITSKHFLAQRRVVSAGEMIANEATGAVPPTF